MMMPRESDLATLAQTTVSFSMVRHPFERIVSAYQDKVNMLAKLGNATASHLKQFQNRKKTPTKIILKQFQ